MEMSYIALGMVLTLFVYVGVPALANHSRIKRLLRHGYLKNLFRITWIYIIISFLLSLEILPVIVSSLLTIVWGVLSLYMVINLFSLANKVIESIQNGED